MCYLPKATFYLYFGFFFVGYIWIFGLLFYRTMYNEFEQERQSQKPVEQQQAFLQNDVKFVNLDDKPGVNYAANSVQQEILTKSETPPLPYVLYDLQRPLPDGTDSAPPCVDLSETKPRFKLCLHDPKIDRALSAYVNLHKTWEPDVTAALKVWLEKFPNVTFVDVGANVGYFSLLAAKSNVANIIAIEPFLDNLLLLHRSARLNNVQHRILAIQNALGDKRDLVKFVDTSDGNVGGRFYLDFDEPKYDSSPKLNTSMIYMNDLLALTEVLRPKTDVIVKFDVQGRECFVLDKANRFFDALRVRAVFLEWSDARTLRSELCNRRMVKFFKSRGFKPTNFDGADISDRFDFRQERLNMLPNFMWLPN